MLYPDWQTERQRRRRGHAFYPSDEELAQWPAAYQTDGIPFEAKEIVAHYFAGSWDWYVAELDRETGEAFCFARNAADPQGAEWGYTALGDLEKVSASGQFGGIMIPGLVIIERDLHWQPRKFGEIAAEKGWRQ